MAKNSSHASKMPTFEELVDQVRSGRLSRRRFFSRLAVAGASATAAGLLLTVIEHRSATPTLGRISDNSVSGEDRNLQLHREHVTRQTSAGNPGGNAAPLTPPDESQLERGLAAIMADYHDDAIVEDMLMGSPVVGLAAIAARKRAELMSIRGAHIEVVNRFAYGDQVVAEWIVTGIHAGDFMGFAGSGNAIAIRGLTVVTRRGEKIAKESLYYDAEDVRRQLTARAL
jgi:steroid delta-isomerase-like uncharacterized protein